jgi:hypothetical protein
LIVASPDDSELAELRAFCEGCDDYIANGGTGLVMVVEETEQETNGPEARWLGRAE